MYLENRLTKEITSVESLDKLDMDEWIGSTALSDVHDYGKKTVSNSGNLRSAAYHL